MSVSVSSSSSKPAGHQQYLISIVDRQAKNKRASWSSSIGQTRTPIRTRDLARRARVRYEKSRSTNVAAGVKNATVVVIVVRQLLSGRRERGDGGQTKVSEPPTAHRQTLNGSERLEGGRAGSSVTSNGGGQLVLITCDNT